MEATPPAVRACEAADLSAIWKGAVPFSQGQMFGSIEIADVWGSECYLNEPPSISLLNEDGEAVGITASATDPCFTGLTCADRIFRVLKPVSGEPDDYSSTTLELGWGTWDDPAAAKCNNPGPRVQGIALTLPGLGNPVDVVPGANPVDFEPCGSHIGMSTYDGDRHFYPLAFELTQKEPYTLIGENLDFTVKVSGWEGLPAQFEDECPTFVVRLLQGDILDIDADLTQIAESSVEYCPPIRTLGGESSFSFDASIPVPSDTQFCECFRAEVFLAPGDANERRGQLDAVVFDEWAADIYDRFEGSTTPAP